MILLPFVSEASTWKHGVVRLILNHIASPNQKWFHPSSISNQIGKTHILNLDSQLDNCGAEEACCTALSSHSLLGNL
jgi:hypothetical protein